MKKLLIPIPDFIPIIYLSENTIQNLSYISICLSMFIFSFGFYRFNKKKPHGIKLIILSGLLLINPVINLVSC
ncbi:hypothetical protein [Romboutsia sp.]|uniref:hypothetical protein n=1 Tax=Romboutsia sp. TaxID=1965302 RepID=UPI003F2D6B0E